MSLGSCLQSAVAEASRQSGISAQEALLAGLEACTAVATFCIRERTEMGSDASACLLPPTEIHHFWSGVSYLLSRAWAFVGWYNAIQLLVMPWVFFWTFSGSVLGLARFLRFQYHLVRIGFDVLLLMLLYLLILVEDLAVMGASRCRARLSGEFREQCRLQRRLRTSATVTEHRSAQRALVDFHARATNPLSCCGRGRGVPATVVEGTEAPWRPETQAAHLARLRSALEQQAAAASDSEGKAMAALRTLEPLLTRNGGGIDWAQAGASRCEEQIVACLGLACSARRRHGKGPELLSWLKARQTSLGRTALCLSGGGSLAMHHMGLCRFLLEEGLMPEIISGVSGGSIVAAFLAIHTDEELLKKVFVPDIVVRHRPHRWFPPWWQELWNFLTLGVLVPTEDFERTAEAYWGTWTFAEAHARTGRTVCVVLSSNFSKQLPACIMLSHITTPNVTIASAVAASCAAMGIMKPRGLVVKDPSTGELSPFDVLGRSFADGTFTAEVPKDYLRSCFGATQFFVSQVNPHVSPFLGCRDGVLQSLRSSFGRDLQRRAGLLSEYHILPAFYGQAMCNATKHLSQDFSESQAGVTMFPPNMGLGSVKAAVTNPSLQDMESYILTGQRMAWCKAEELSARMRIELALAEEVRRLAEGAQ